MIEKEDGWKVFQRVKAEKEARVKAAKENEAKVKEAKDKAVAAASAPSMKSPPRSPQRSKVNSNEPKQSPVTDWRQWERSSKEKDEADTRRSVVEEALKTVAAASASSSMPLNTQSGTFCGTFKPPSGSPQKSCVNCDHCSPLRGTSSNFPSLERIPNAAKLPLGGSSSSGAASKAEQDMLANFLFDPARQESNTVPNTSAYVQYKQRKLEEWKAKNNANKTMQEDVNPATKRNITEMGKVASTPSPARNVRQKLGTPGKRVCRVI